jgi:uncharacterized membrane protein
MAKGKEAAAKPASKEDDGKIFAFLAYLLGIIGFLIVLLAKKDNKFAMYHAKQSLVLFIVSIGVWILAMIPFIGWFILGPIGWICIIVLAVIGMINALTGKEKELPFIGKYAAKFEF